MKPMIRVLLAFLFFALSIIFAAPTLTFLSLAAAYIYGKWLCALFTFLFAWHVAKLVELGYERYRVQNNESSENTVETIQGEGYHYHVEDGKITFTFTGIPDDDGRQVSRLKFMREKFFKD